MNIGISLVPEFEELYNRFVNDEKGIQLLQIEGIAPRHLDVGSLSYDFFNRDLADTSTDSNSNFVENYSPSSYRTSISNGQMKLLGYHLLWYHTMKRYGIEFANKAISTIWNGGLHFHDAHGIRIQMPYCYAFSLMNMVLEGRPYGSSPNTPPKNRKSFLSQVDKLISDLSKEFAGATAPSDFFLWYAYFCKKEGLMIDDHNEYEDGKEILNDFQGLVCLFNEPSRAEGEPPFTNVALYDMVGLKNLFGHIVYPDGSKPDLKYIMKLQKMFARWFSQGDRDTGFPYKFPVVTMNMTTDKHGMFVDKETCKSFAEYNVNMGNFNLHFGEESKLAMCCRYTNDLDDMNMTPDSFGNGGLNIGSHRVITLNMPRVVQLAANHEGVFKKIDEYMDIACKLLLVHRYDILENRIEKNPDYLQFFGRLKWFNMKTMFSTFGITGMNEMCELTGRDILEDSGTEFILDVLSHINSNVKKYRKEHQVTFNVEEIPGEQTCVSLLKKDKIYIGNPQLQEFNLYSNQYIPLTKDASIYDRIDLSGRFMSMISGGGIVHINHEAKIDNGEKMYELMRFAAMSGVPHFAVCYRFGKCENGHVNIIGSNRNCPNCGGFIERARNRVIGYYSDEIYWSPTRRKHDAPFRKFKTFESEE